MGGPAGAMRTMFGVSRSAIVPVVHRDGQPAACAMAVRWSIVFVEPPKAMSSTMPLWIAAGVTMSSAVMPFSTRSITCMPAAWRGGCARNTPQARCRCRERQAEGLGQAVHRVRREHARAAAAGGTGGVREALATAPPRSWCRRDLAHGVEKRVQVARFPHLSCPASMGPPETSMVGMFRRARGDEHAGHDLVAAGDEDHGVELVALDRALNRICDDLARDGVVHALVVHGDAVAHADGGSAAACRLPCERPPSRHRRSVWRWRWPG